MGDNTGVTLLELVVALTVGGILMGIAVNAYGGAQGRSALRSAESSFLSMHAQTRASAVERGERVRLVVDSGNDRVSIVAGTLDDPITLRTQNFLEAFGTVVRSVPELVELCMTPRGFAELGCNSFSSEATIAFARGGQEREVRILPLGQVAR